MTLVLQRTSPEQRQIDLPTIFQMYINAMEELLKCDHFTRKTTEDSFKISQEDDNVDVKALSAAVAAIVDFVGVDGNKSVACNAILEAKFISVLVGIPKKVIEWRFDRQHLAVTIVNTLSRLCRDCEKIQQSLINSTHITTLFSGLHSFGCPSHNLLKACLNFAFNEDTNQPIIGKVATSLIEWIPEMIENEQNYITEQLLLCCRKSLAFKRVVCENKSICRACEALKHHTTLSSKSITNLINLIEELAKYNIYSVEVKYLLQLMRSELNFGYRKQLLEAVLKISQSRLSLGLSPTEFLDIQTDMNGITVPDIKRWDPSHGFVFHIWLRLDPFDEHKNTKANYRRHVFSLTTNQGYGFEFFIQKNGNFVVSVITRKEVLTVTVSSVQLLIGNWHSITVVVAPPKRLFSYYQVNVYMDGNQKLGSTMKFVSFQEPFTYCSIGAPFNKVRRPSNSKHLLKRMDEVSESSPPAAVEKSKSIFPNIFEKTIPGIVSQSSISSIWPMQSLKSSSSLDPSVKPIQPGMQDAQFGELVCLRGQIGCVILADSTINLKQLFDAGSTFANIIATDLIESFDVGSRFVFCYSPTACSDGLCLDLAPGGRFNGHVMENYCRAVSIQDSINGVGGVLSLLPILDQIVQSPSMYSSMMELMDSDGEKTPTKDISESDWEMLNNSLAQDAKITKNPIACFLCLLRNFISQHELNQECILKEDAVAIIGSLLVNCPSELFDVNVLMAIQHLVEAIQNDMPGPNIELLRSFYRDILFDFRIWARTQFQIIIGHIQYIQALIKDDRKFFR